MNRQRLTFGELTMIMIKVLYCCICIVLVSTVLWLIARAVAGCILQWT